MHSRPTSVVNLVQFAMTEQNESQQSASVVGSTDSNDILDRSSVLRKRKVENTSDDSWSEDGWKTVTRGRKVVRKSDEDQNVQVCITCAKELPKQFALAKLFKEHDINDIIKVKYTSSTRIIVTFEKELSADKLLQTKAFSDLEWRCLKTTEVGLSYGVIKNIELDLSEEELLKHLSCSLDIVSAKRLSRRNTEDNGSTWVVSESVRLGFKGSSVPSHVFIHRMRIKVESYIFPVTQCGRCWKFGHSTKFCPNKKPTCPKCTNKHENCEVTDFKCVNCYGSHMAMHKICPVFKKERKIRELMSENNITYRKALSLYESTRPVSDRLIRNTNTNIEGEHSYAMPMAAEESIIGDSDYCASTSYADTVKSVQYKKDKEGQPSQKQEQKQHKNHDLQQQQRQVQQEQDQDHGHLSVHGLGIGRGKKKHRKQKHTLPQTNWREEPAECFEGEHNSHTNSTNETIQENNGTFHSLLNKLKDIIFSRQSLDKKIELSLKICFEWFLAKAVSSISAGTFLGSTHSYG